MIELLLDYGGERCYLCGSTDLDLADRSDYSCHDCVAEYDVTINGDVILYGSAYHLVISHEYPELEILYFISRIRSRNRVTFE